MLLIDWEWIAVASPAFDVAYYAWGVGSGFYFERYLAYGGTSMDQAMWERACALAGIFEGVKAFPMFAGAANYEGCPYYDPSQNEALRRQAEAVTEAMGTWLG